MIALTAQHLRSRLSGHQNANFQENGQHHKIYYALGHEMPLIAVSAKQFQFA